MKRASYRDAIQWIVDNDDTEWIGTTPDDDDPISVTAAFVADLFDIDSDKVTNDIRRALKKVSRR